MTEFAIGLIIGVVIGAAVTIAVVYLRGRTADRQLRETFASLAGEALESNSKRLREQTEVALDGKKQLIDQTVKAVNERLESVRQMLQRVEAERKKDLGRLGSSVNSLAATTGKLHEMLASSKRRGAWGERMAEDVLRLAGMQENVNYVKQSGEDAESGRPDFTFFLPNDLKANMDVKFPLEKYRQYLDSDSDERRQASARELVTAVRGHVRAIASRGYIDPKAPTVPYVLVFLPSEQMYSLVLETQPDLMDEALRMRVVLTSPLTLYAMLAVVRQAAENANILKTADEVISLLNQFSKQWDRYKAAFDRIGERIEAVSKEYETVRTTRTNMLERPLAKIDELRTSRQLAGGADNEDDPKPGQT